MEINFLDCIYLGFILAITVWLFYMEIQIKEIKTMMEEHVKFDADNVLKKYDGVNYELFERNNQK